MTEDETESLTYLSLVLLTGMTRGYMMEIWYTSADMTSLVEVFWGCVRVCVCVCLCVIAVRKHENKIRLQATDLFNMDKAIDLNEAKAIDQTWVRPLISIYSGVRLLFCCSIVGYGQ